ncbi:MAG: sulfotransferase [Acidobacteriota bacterium]
MGFMNTWRRLRYGEPIIVVSGLPRSGTSMAMKMLDAAGVDTTTDGERTADEDNPKGYFEDERVKDLEKMTDRSWVRDSRGKAIKVISFLLKSLPADNNYKVIFMRRDLDEVLASQQKMLDRRGEENSIDDEQMRELWKNHLWRSNYMLKNQPQFEFVEILYSDVLADPETNARRIADFIGGLDARKMAEVVDPDLYRNRAPS